MMERTASGYEPSHFAGYEVKLVVRTLRELYADTPVAEFGPLCVKAARQKWVNEGRNRSECNRRVALVKWILKWAVPPAVARAAVGSHRGKDESRRLVPPAPGGIGFDVRGEGLRAGARVVSTGDNAPRVPIGPE